MSAMALATAEEAQVAGASSGCVVVAGTDVSLEAWSTGVPSPPVNLWVRTCRGIQGLLARALKNFISTVSICVQRLLLGCRRSCGGPAAHTKGNGVSLHIGCSDVPGLIQSCFPFYVH